MIIKTYRKKGCGFVGQDSESWSSSWGNISEITESFRNAEKTHLAFFFNKYFPRPPKKILEGGCGTDKYVHAFRKQGYNIVGVDFASATVKLINDNFPDLPVSEANVLSLPFKDGEFDCYYSGGVIEHFENGPDLAVKEARRILKKGGIFLATVPYVNILRKTRFTLFPRSQHGDLFQLKVDTCGEADPNSTEYAFCEYMFDGMGIESFFKKNGFTVIKTYPTDFLWGELGGVVRWGLNRKKITKGQNDRDSSSPVPSTDTSARWKYSIRNALYNLIVTEDRSNKLFCPLIFLMNLLSGHMIMVVARAD